MCLYLSFFVLKGFTLAETAKGGKRHTVKWFRVNLRYTYKGVICNRATPYTNIRNKTETDTWRRAKTIRKLHSHIGTHAHKKQFKKKQRNKQKQGTNKLKTLRGGLRLRKINNCNRKFFSYFLQSKNVEKIFVF